MGCASCRPHNPVISTQMLTQYYKYIPDRTLINIIRRTINRIGIPPRSSQILALIDV